ncbi:hypothetical protein H5410_036770 [Solanum commersonii]|uniref:RNase H type-1 domain-containing protein n=1 Tax=Solanum commersonii TaxID=4109 RepID=A0A9J5Y670_SOLCO|nr:hypothetical protein H5410_036770 [Solanum commersonii]
MNPPKRVIDQIHQIFANFFPGSLVCLKGKHWVAWENMCISKEEGGLGFRSLHEVNNALFEKLWWNFRVFVSSLWCSYMRNKYCKKVHPIVVWISEASHVWRKMLAIREEKVAKLNEFLFGEMIAHIVEDIKPNVAKMNDKSWWMGTATGNFTRVWKKRIAMDDNSKKMNMNIVSKCYCCEKGENPKLQHIMKVIPATIMWELWKRRNARRHDKELSFNKMFSQCQLIIHQLIRAKYPWLRNVPYHWAGMFDMVQRIEKIHQMMAILHIQVEHIFRETNQLADCITSLAIDQEERQQNVGGHAVGKIAKKNLSSLRKKVRDMELDRIRVHCIQLRDQQKEGSIRNVKRELKRNYWVPLIVDQERCVRDTDDQEGKENEAQAEGSRKLFNKLSARIGESYNTSYIALRRSGQRSSSRRLTCNDKVLPDVPGDQIHLKEAYIILHSRNTLLNALESWRNLGEKNQENNRIIHNSEDRISKNKGISENPVEKGPINLDPKQDMFLGMMQIITAHKWYVKCTILIDNSFSITNIAMIDSGADVSCI